MIHRIHWAFLCLLFLMAIPLACSKTYTLGPLSSTPTPGGSSCSNAGVVSTLAGSAGVTGLLDGTGTAALFNDPDGVAVDTAGNIYVLDFNNNDIRKISSAGAVTTFAGGGPCCAVDGIGTAASFNEPGGIAVDNAGNVFVSDTYNLLIRKITPSGAVTTIAGTVGVPGSANGMGTAASFNYPFGIAVDSSDNLYVADTANCMIRKITSAGLVSTFAGSTTPGSANGTGTAASFTAPQGLAVDSTGTIYVADTVNNMIRVITPSGVVSTLAGSAGVTGSTNATGTSASFNTPTGVTVDTCGNVYVADILNNMIRKITPGDVVTTLAGQLTLGSTNATGTSASFDRPAAVALDASGNLYVADAFNSLVRKIH